MYPSIFYEINIKYPNYQNEAFNKKIQTYIKEKEQEFTDSIYDDKLEKDYDFYVNYTEDFYKHIETIHFTIFAYTGGAHEERMDAIFYYDKKNNKELMISNIINNNRNFYHKLSEIATNKLMQTKKELIFQDELLKEGLKPNKENFKYLIFTEEGLKIIFPPYQVGPWSSGAIDILIPYDEIKDYMKIK